MMNRLRDRLIRFMYGRNGNDNLNSFILAVACVLLLVSGFLGGVIRSVCYIPALALLVISYLRMFSKNIYKRREENRKYLDMKYRVFGYLKGIKERWVQRKDYKFFSCPSCHATMRVPRGHGKIRIVCKKCGNAFVGKS